MKTDKYIMLIIKTLSGEASSEDKEGLQHWISENEQNAELYRDYTKIWDISGPGVDTEIETIDIEEEWNQQKSRSVNKPIVRRISSKRVFYQRISAVAAVLTVVSALLWYFIRTPETTLYAELQPITAKLADGSQVNINRNSSLTYSEDFNKNDRTVKLTGDAFFDVEPNPEKAFIIESGASRVEVVGTKFYIKSQQAQTEVIVSQGTVLLYSVSGLSDTLVLTAGEQGMLNKQTGITKEQPNSDSNYLSWKTGKLTFDNQPLKTVLADIADLYNCRFIIENPQINTCKITATFENESLTTVLTVLGNTLNLDIRKKKEEYIINGIGCN